MSTLAKLFNQTLQGHDGKYSSRRVTAFVLVIVQIACVLYHVIAQDGRHIVELCEFMGIETLALFGITTGGNILESKKKKQDGQD